MRGNITRRGKSSWRIKFDCATGEDGQRKYHVETVKGTKADAQALLAKRLNEFAEGRHVNRSGETLESYAMHWLENIAPNDRCPATVERYRTLITAHIVPGLGGVTLQALDGPTLDRFYSRCRTQGRRDGKGLSPMTLRHVNALLSQVLKSAVMANLIAQSPIAKAQTKPKKPKRSKIEVLDESELVALLDHLRGHWLYMPVLIAAYTGLRRGEVLGLRWRDVDLLNGTLQVSQAVEVIGGELHITAPKTERSHRTITLPAALVPELARHRKEQSSQRLKLGLGKDRADLVFTNGEGKMIDPTVLSISFSRAVTAAGVKRITFHGLRHGHITYLLRAGVPVHIVSARAGHARASITLDTYSHLMTGDDASAAMQADEMLRRTLK